MQAFSRVVSTWQVCNDSPPGSPRWLADWSATSRTAVEFAYRLGLWCAIFFAPIGLGRLEAQDVTAREPLRTLFVTRSLTHPRLMEYLQTARPQIVQIGNYGAMFHGYADNPRSTGWPMQLPVSGERAALDYQRELNEKVHELGSLVVGHFRLVKVMGNWEEQTGFVDYYQNRWPRQLLGPKPHPELAELLQRDAQGQPIQLGRSGHAQLALCLSSPHARELLKRMLKVAVDHHVDGVITTYNYRFECACPHCQAAFKGWLQDKLSPDEIRETLQIENLDSHVFEEIPVRIPGYVDDEDPQSLQRYAMLWGAEHFKTMYDKIVIDYGRSLKKDLIVAQWNHLGHVKATEERMFLPADRWAKDEDYLWYSGGASFVGDNLSLSDGKAGDAWLSCLYTRELSGGKPFVIGKYDRTRMAVSMAEGFATGGLGMGRYMRFEEPEGFEVLARYTRFRNRHDDLYAEARPYAEVALVLPRASLWKSSARALDDFRDLGQALLENQVLVDVLLDENVRSERLSQYRVVLLPNFTTLDELQQEALNEYAKSGGRVLARPENSWARNTGKMPGGTREGRQNVVLLPRDLQEAVKSVESDLRDATASNIDAPWTVRVAAYRQANRMILHLVNYDRQPDASESNRKGPVEERPKAVENISMSISLPPDKMATAVKLLAPERSDPLSLPFDSAAGRLTIQLPRLYVYAVLTVDLEPAR